MPIPPAVYEERPLEETAWKTITIATGSVAGPGRKNATPGACLVARRTERIDPWIYMNGTRGHAGTTVPGGNLKEKMKPGDNRRGIRRRIRRFVGFMMKNEKKLSSLQHAFALFEKETPYSPYDGGNTKHC